MLSLPLQVYQIKEELEDKSVTYPSYYMVPFHAYSEGNLSWQAAFEVSDGGPVLSARHPWVLGLVKSVSGTAWHGALQAGPTQPC